MQAALCVQSPKHKKKHRLVEVCKWPGEEESHLGREVGKLVFWQKGDEEGN